MSLIDQAADLFATFAKNLRERGLEYTSGRYYGKYMGVVSSTEDPQAQGRVKIKAEVVTGRNEEMERWALPSADFAGKDKGLFLPPDEGDVVWTWFDHGDPTQPRYSGSYWGNTSRTKTPDTSHVPAEFRTTVGPVTTRGFKSKGGHGWLVEDSADKGRRFEVWTGEQTTAGQAATKHHRVVLNDESGAEEVLVTSFGDQKVRLIDIAGQESIEVTTAQGLFAKLLDYIQKIEIGGPLGYKLTIDEQTQQIVIETPVGNKIEIKDTGSIINIQDATGNSAKLSPTGIDVTSLVNVNVNAAAQVNIAAAAAAAITAGGALSIQGTGLSLQSAGGGPSVQVASGVTNNNFVGLKTETLLGGLVQTVIGLWQIGATIMEVIAPTINLGSPGVKFLLVDSRFIALYNAHTHTAIGLGAPTGPPLIPATIGLQTTSAVAAN